MIFFLLLAKRNTNHFNIFKKSKSGGKRYNNNKLQIQKNPPKKSVTDYSGSRRGSSQNESGFRSRSDSDVDIFSGTYHFDKYDDGLEEYLNSLGLSGDELGRIVRNAQIRITLRKPLYPDTKWSLTTYETGTIHSCCEDVLLQKNMPSITSNNLSF